MKNQNYYQLIIVVGVFLFYGRILSGDMPFAGDYLIYQLPEKTLIRECLQQGVMPFINPYILSGTPIMENIATGSFYPLNILLIFGSPVFGFNLFIFIHILLAGWAMYMLLKKGVNLHQYACCIGGLSYALSGPLWGMVDKGFIVSAWLVPLFFLGVILLYSSVKQKRIFGYISSIGALTLLFYSGNLLETYFAIIVAGIGSVWFAFFAESANGANSANPDMLRKEVDLTDTAGTSNIEHPASKYRMNGNVINYHTIKLLFTYVFLVFTSILLAMPQLLPTYKASLISYRSSGMGLESAQHWSFPAMRIIEYFVPFAFGSRSNGGLSYGHFYTNNAHGAGGSPWFDAVFTGFPILCAAIFLFFSLSANFAKSFREKKIRLYQLFRNKFFILFIGLIFFLLLALGRQTPLYSLCYHILPGFKVFRHPEKFIEWVNILLIIFGTYGLDRLFRFANSADSRLFRRVSLYSGVAIFAIFAILSSMFLLLPAKYGEFFHEMGSRWNGKNIYLWQSGALLVSAAVLLCIYILTRKYDTNHHKMAAVFIIITIFYSFAWSLMIHWTVPVKEFNRVVTWDRLLPEFDNSQWRIYAVKSFRFNSAVPEFTQYTSLENNAASFVHRKTPSGFSALMTSKYINFFNFKKHHPMILLNMLSVKYVATPYLPDDKIPANFAIITRDQPANIAIFENKTALPRCKAYTELDKVTPELLQYKLFAKRNTPVSRMPLITKFPDNYQSDASKEKMHPYAEITEDLPGKISVRVTDGPCWVVLRDWFAPGWHCYDSTEKEIPIVEADGGVMAVYVNKQNEDVYFRYMPPGLKIGILCAICGLLIVFFTLVMYFYHTKQ